MQAGLQNIYMFDYFCRFYFSLFSTQIAQIRKFADLTITVRLLEMLL
jgi:hypothetical protein